MSPWSSNKARVAWSIIPALLTIVWVFGNLAGTVTAFPASYTLRETLMAVWNGRVSHMVRYAGIDVLPWGIPDVVCWVWPVALMGCWVLLITARSRRNRAMCACAIAVLAGWIVLVAPVVLLMPVIFADFLAGRLSGENYQDGLLQIATITPWLVLSALCLYKALTQAPTAGMCGRCGYSLAGLGSAICPECGEPAARSVSQ